MSVISVKEIHNGRGGGDEVNEKRGSANDTRVFRVVTNSNYDDTTVVLGSCDMLGSVHPGNSNLFLARRRATNESFSKRVWIATLEYQTGREQSENPLRDLPVITWDTESKQVVVTKDKDGNAILNSAGDYYEDPPTDEENDFVVNISKKVAYVPPAILSYRNAINVDAFVIDGISVDAYQAKISKISISSWEQKNDIWFRNLSMGLKLNDSWLGEYLDQGLYRTVSVPPPEGSPEGTEPTSEKVRCVAEDGTEVTKPVLLDGEGGQLAGPTPETAIFNTHHVRPELQFASIMNFLQYG